MALVCGPCLDKKHDSCPMNLWMTGMNTTEGVPMSVRVTCDCAIEGHSGAIVIQLNHVLSLAIQREQARRREVEKIA
jgi:hypothetical protein